jgi:hypothetical protein
MNTGTIIHARDASVTIESVDYQSFVSTAVRIISKDGSESSFSIFTDAEPIIELLPTRVSTEFLP